MPAPRWLARVNHHILNPFTRPVAGRVPGYGIVVQKGRKTGREYRTPVMAFRRPGRVIIPLTYGRQSQWVRNVIASGGCQFINRGETLGLIQPRVYHDPGHAEAPKLIGMGMKLIRIDDFLELKVSERAGS